MNLEKTVPMNNNKQLRHIVLFKFKEEVTKSSD